MNGYFCFYKGKKCEVHAETVYKAQQKAQEFFKCKRGYEITVILAEKEDVQVTHIPTM